MTVDIWIKIISICVILIDGHGKNKYAQTSKLCGGRAMSMILKLFQMLQKTHARYDWLHFVHFNSEDETNFVYECYTMRCANSQQGIFDFDLFLIRQMYQITEYGLEFRKVNTEKIRNFKWKLWLTIQKYHSVCSFYIDKLQTAPVTSFYSNISWKLSVRCTTK